MKQVKVPIDRIEQIAKQTYRLQVKLPDEQLQEIKPGQFIHIRVGSGVEHVLRRPISIADVDLEKKCVTVIFKVFGEGTNKLSQMQSGQLLDFIIPCGNGYPIDDLNIKHALLIGGGIGVPPLYYLAKKLVEKGIGVTTIIGFQTKEELFYEHEFKQLGSCFVATSDGSYGIQGFVTDALKNVNSEYDYYFSCGPTAMLKAVRERLSHLPGYISLEERMGCGIGACYACVVPSANGEQYKKVCADGPVFEANEVTI